MAVFRKHRACMQLFLNLFVHATLARHNWGETWSLMPMFCFHTRVVHPSLTFRWRRYLFHVFAAYPATDSGTGVLFPDR